MESKPAAWARAVATVFGIGYLRPGAGTWAAAATTLLWSALGRHLSPSPRIISISLICMIVVALGIPASTYFARAVGKKDPPEVVIDEVAGQVIAMIAVPVIWTWLLMSFLAFRFFDILKPWPIRRLEHLPEGTGIVVDDLVAGIYGLIVVHVLLRFHLFR